MNDHGIGIRDIQSGLDNRRCHEYINISVDEVVHDFLQFALGHLPVSEGDPCFRQQFLQPVRHIHNRIHPVINVINLAAPRQFPCDGFADNFLIVFHHKGLNRKPVLRRFLQHAHIPDTDQ